MNTEGPPSLKLQDPEAQPADLISFLDKTKQPGGCVVLEVLSLAAVEVL